MAILLSIGAIVFGHIHWKMKINDSIVSANDEVIEENEEVTAEQIEGEQREDQQVNLADLTQNLEEKAAIIVKDAVASGETLDVAIIGSGAQTKGEQPWPELVQAGLDHAYGEGVFSIQNHSFGDEFSIYAIRKDEMYSIIDDQPDIVILEPFLLNDNVDINIDDTIDSIRILKRQLTKANENIVFMVQPPHPIFEPTLYATQVDRLEQYAEEEGVTYLNHWENWPSVSDEEIKNYVLEDISGPNDEGNQLWAEYIVNYFTGK